MSLLDELKKTGLANDKKAKQIEREKKQQQHKDLKSGEARKQAEAAQKTAAAVAMPQPVDVAAKASEQLARLYKNAEVHNASGRKKFYFTTCDNYIDCLNISDVASILIDRGKFAIVANQNLDDYIVVKRATALAIEAIDKSRIVVLHRTEI